MIIGEKKTDRAFNIHIKGVPMFLKFDPYRV
jgi:hypothetical protein